jgi:hypothetical protein
VQCLFRFLPSFHSATTKVAVANHQLTTTAGKENVVPFLPCDFNWGDNSSALVLYVFSRNRRKQKEEAAAANTGLTDTQTQFR